MKTFRDFLKEDVMPTAQVADGSLDINKPAVRAAINAAIAGVTSQPAVTPYVVYNRLSKLLAQYHIILPKKFLEGDKGVEVFELRQFGHKMGMTDSGEFVNEVPSTHYLFLQYGILTPYGITYAKPIVGGMFKVMARVVDKEELDKLLDIAEITMSEEAECRQMSAKANAPKEPMHDITSDEKKKGNKEAVSDSEKGLNEVSLGKLVRYKNKAGEGREKGVALADKKMKGKAKVNASAPKHPYMEETVEEGRMPASVIKHKQKLANMTPEEKAKKFAGKSEEQLKSMARRHGYGKDSNEYSKTVKEEQIDEKAPPGAKFERMVKHIKKGYAKDGELTAKEKGIAFATAWKAKNKEQSE
jgi:hypothetical protein